MLKNVLALLSLFLIVFIGALALLGGEFEQLWGEVTSADPQEFQEQVANPGPTGTSPAAPRTPDERASNNDPAADRIDAAERDGPGRLQGRAYGPDDTPLGLIQTRLIPDSGVLVRTTGDDWLIKDVSPGEYRLEIRSEGFVPAVIPVSVSSGRRSWHDVRLEPGVQPAGTVIDETTHEAVGGALIEFSGGGQCRSAPNGAFRAPYVIPLSALKEITVSHEDYDRYTYVRKVDHDPEDMTVPLSRGNGRIEGALIPDAEIAPGQRARLRLFFTTGGRRDLRRQKVIPVTQQFVFRRVHQGVYDLVVDFPGTRLTEVHREVRLRVNETAKVEIRFGDGSTVNGRITALAGNLGGHRIELINGKGVPVSATVTDAAGTFRLTAIPPGKYRVKVHYGNPRFNTEAFDVDGVRDMDITVDCDRKRLRR